MTPTVCIKWPAPNGSDFAHINQSDFDPQIHQLFGAEEVETTEEQPNSEQLQEVEVEPEVEPTPAIAKTPTRKTRKATEQD